MLVIGIAGGSGSGKTTVVKELVRQLPENSVSVISQRTLQTCDIFRCE